jgi:hypothetical protein
MKKKEPVEKQTKITGITLRECSGPAEFDEAS